MIFLGTPIVEQTEHSIHEMDVKAFNLILSALQYLMSSEQQLMAGIIPHQYQKGIFEKISRDSLDLVILDLTKEMYHFFHTFLQFFFVKLAF